jgi:hypothetical protein
VVGPSLPYLAARYDQLKALVQLRALCGGPASWREAGCAALEARLDAAERELTSGLPRRIAEGLAALRARGMAAPALQAAQDQLAAGDVKAAALAYDTAVRASEGT